LASSAMTVLTAAVSKIAAAKPANRIVFKVCVCGIFNK